MAAELARQATEERSAASSASASASAPSASSVPAALSPSSWARATVPLYSALPGAYSADFASAGRFLVPTASQHQLYAAQQQQHQALHQAGRYSDPISLRGLPLFLRLAFVFHVGLWLVRDSSLTSFLLYGLFITGLLYFLIVRGEPFSLALVVESAESLAAKASGASTAAVLPQPMQPMQPFPAQYMQPQQARPSPSPSSSSSGSPPTPGFSKSAPMAFAFNKPASASSSSSSSSAIPPTLDVVSPTPTAAPVFHESDSSRVESLRVPSSIDPSDMPQTPSVEPVITPMPTRPAESSSSAAPVVSTLHVPTESTPVVIAGATARHSSTDAEMSWTRAIGSSYDVRVGPNYKKYGKKAASKGALYECVGVDVFGAPDGKLEHIAAHLQLPWIAKKNNAPAGEDPWVSTAVNPVKPIDDAAPPHELDPVTKAWDHYEVDPEILRIDEELGGVPTMFIVNFQIPTYAPGYFSSKEDGEGFSIVLYYQITHETRMELKSGKLSGAVQLLKDFVNNAGSFEYHSRFKCIPRIVNPSEAKVGMATRQAMRMYNAKPFLTGPHCHSFVRGPGYMEADIDVHRFCLSARKGAYGTLDALNSLIVDIGFVIEAGRENADEELPEMILACGRVAHLDPLHAKSLQHYIEVGKAERAKRLAQ